MGTVASKAKGSSLVKRAKPVPVCGSLDTGRPPAVDCALLNEQKWRKAVRESASRKRVDLAALHLSSEFSDKWQEFAATLALLIKEPQMVEGYSEPAIVARVVREFLGAVVHKMLYEWKSMKHRLVFEGLRISIAIHPLRGDLYVSDEANVYRLEEGGHFSRLFRAPGLRPYKATRATQPVAADSEGFGADTTIASQSGSPDFLLSDVCFTDSGRHLVCRLRGDASKRLFCMPLPEDTCQSGTAPKTATELTLFVPRFYDFDCGEDYRWNHSNPRGKDFYKFMFPFPQMMNFVDVNSAHALCDWQKMRYYWVADFKPASDLPKTSKALFQIDLSLLCAALYANSVNATNEGWISEKWSAAKKSTAVGSFEHTEDVCEELSGVSAMRRKAQVFIESLSETQRKQLLADYNAVCTYHSEDAVFHRMYVEMRSATLAQLFDGDALHRNKAHLFYTRLLAAFHFKVNTLAAMGSVAAFDLDKLRDFAYVVAADYSLHRFKLDDAAADGSQLRRTHCVKLREAPGGVPLGYCTIRYDSIAGRLLICDSSNIRALYF